LTVKKVIVGCDHAAVEAKAVVVTELQRLGYKVEDVGAHSSDSVDYPDYAARVAEAVATGESWRGILLCGTGIGMAITANKVPGIRAAVVRDVGDARMSRLHNDANVLALGGRVLGEDLMQEITRVWLSTEFEGGRHQRRIDKITTLEKKHGGRG